MSKSDTTKIKIPLILQELLAKDNSLNIAVQDSISQFIPWIEKNDLYFFPEYTNHGIDHIETVFETAKALIRNEAWQVFTPADAATLLLAVLLHDSAMHLTPDSFVALLDKQNTQYLIEGLDEKTWRITWDEFILEALRFDQRKLVAIFGNVEPVKVPEIDPQKMTGRDAKLIGEFLRRHHHRLAHQIACFGVPGPENDRIGLRHVDKDIADLAGLVARSHGMPVRLCIDYLQSKYGDKCEHKRIHAVFLMSLLRVADYLQIQPERAQRQILKVTKLQSPVSKGHWNIHHAINDIRNTHADPEALYIHALPSNIATFLKIKQLLLDIQCELDAAWAIIGEVYGRMTTNNFHLFGLNLRRIRSNMDDIDTFEQQVKYIPIRAAFTTADPHVLNLLVGPLYNCDPAFGVRELIQNAVDAVRELWEYTKTHQRSKIMQLRDQKADVTVSIKKDRDNDQLWLVVSDQGIGMTPKVVSNYFLRAGASFRESDVWRKEFTTEKRRAKILRTGRFGIGVLAAFLIGDQIHVVTRHVDTPPESGIEFTASLDMDTIELKNIRCKIGTEIRIRIFENLAREYNKAKWQSATDWYYLLHPSVRIEIESKQVQPKYILPSTLVKKLPYNWRRTSHPHYQDIHWTYSNAPALACNGFKINESKSYRAFDISPQDDIAGSIITPNLHVFDPDGNLPLNLKRTDLNQDPDFKKELSRDILKDFLAFILVCAPTKPLRDSSTWGFYQYLAYPGLDAPIRRLAPWICTDQGASILDSWHISQICPKSAISFFLNPENELLQYCVPSPSAPLIALQWPPIERHFSAPSSPISILCSHLLKRPDPELKRLPSIPGMRIFLHSIFISNLRNIVGSSSSSAKRATKTSQNIEIFQKFISKYGEQLHRAPKIELDTSEWCLFSLGNCPKPSRGLQGLIRSQPKCLKPEASILVEWYFRDTSINPTNSPISKAWREIIKVPVIPYDQKERRKKLDHAFKALAPFVEGHEEMLRRAKKFSAKKNKSPEEKAWSTPMDKL